MSLQKNVPKDLFAPGRLANHLAILVLCGAVVPAAIADDPAKDTKTSNNPRVLGEIEKGFIEIRNPKRLGVKRIAAERIYLGKYYKPNIVRLPNNELRIVGMACQPHKNFYQQNEHPIFRPADGGRT